jgi:hypothetical protein
MLGTVAVPPPAPEPGSAIALDAATDDEAHGYAAEVEVLDTASVDGLGGG